MIKLVFSFFAAWMALTPCLGQDITGTWGLNDLSYEITYKNTGKKETVPEVAQMMKMVDSRMIIGADHTIVHQVGPKGGKLQTIDKGTYTVVGNSLVLNWDAAKKIQESNDRSLKEALAKLPRSIKLSFSAGTMTWTIETDGKGEDGQEGHVVAQWVFKRM